MPRKPPSAEIQAPAETMYVTWGEGDDQAKALALYAAGAGASGSAPVVRSHASNIWHNVGPNNVSVRDSFDRRDYESFRHGEELPTRAKEYIKQCSDAYDNVGIIRNVVDLMADFAMQGIDVNHPQERQEKIYKEWFRRVHGKERSERFLNLLFRLGNVIVQRHTAKLPVRIERQMRSQGSPDMEIVEPPKVEKREVPWKYTFRDPLSTEVIADELSMFVGQDAFRFAIKIPSTLSGRIKSPRTDAEKAIIAKLPEDVRKAILSGGKLIPLDPNKVRAFYYKRDDWQLWARPMASAILSDLQVLQKMKLADLAALDGAISSIRVWRLGNIEARILPTPAMMNRLAEMLCNNVGGGVMDLVWGPDIDLVETKTDVHHFLGETKYAPVLTAIYAGLGIPPTLTGAATQGGFTNNYISLKTLTERLQYGRDLLTQFWQEEIRLFQRAMGFKTPATLVFDRMVLSDEAAEKQLLIHLWDRNLISDESIMERFKETPEIEQVRIRRENKKRKRGAIPEKSSPFHAGEKEHEYKKLFIGTRTVAPSEIGLELEERKQGESSPAEIDAKLTPKQQGANDKPKGQPGQGRPKLSRDKDKRKQKRVTPRSSAEFLETLAWAEQAQTKIGQLVGPVYLKAVGKRNLRELTDEETANFEKYKFFALCQLTPGQEVDQAAVAQFAAKPLSIPSFINELLKQTIATHLSQHGKEPTLEVVRRYQAGAYALWAEPGVFTPEGDEESYEDQRGI